ncbi:hypothetical protein D0Z07_1635 [Hyphodiscus hymeniophilus]|uniref:GmrSD restriction endonucleases N-terminal domain-containing protein n=1 Tax=Hyphodiscus hymeniophilus TaxID=353542 RepID=A0A9P6VPP1_9HELO|nr:hypothetical protein D0Z07_1635 [Hyphodiscus hymeniophilus]
MTSGSRTETIIETPRPKMESATLSSPVLQSWDPADVPINIKKEESEDVKISFPAENEDIFNEVDGPEYVDLSYEGLAEVDGVEHFISQPVVIIRPLSSLYDCIESTHIVLNPDYQREVVWDETRASNLITSILMGYFIPPIIFNVKVKSSNSGGRKVIEHKRICVDGKQRLTSLQKFMNGQIGFFDCNHPSKKWFFCHPKVNGVETFSNHNILPSPVKEFFKSKAFCCYEYDELTVETEETMFQLVQRGVALTPAEKMRAMSTEWAAFTKQYEDDYPMIVNLSKQNRASGFRLILTIFTMIQEVNAGRRKRTAAPTLQASPQALIRVLEDKSPINPLLKLRFKAIFDKFEVLVKMSSTRITTTRYKINHNSVFDPAPDFLRGEDVEHVRTFSPLELIATAILVSYHMDTRSDADLLEDVKEMRHHLRVKHKDLRVNAQCWITVWEYITKLEKKRPSPGSTPEAEVDSSGSSNAQAQNSASSSSQTSPDGAKNSGEPYKKISPKRLREREKEPTRESPRKKAK